jgi:hypothetical protein
MPHKSLSFSAFGSFFEYRTFPQPPYSKFLFSLQDPCSDLDPELDALLASASGSAANMTFSGRRLCLPCNYLPSNKTGDNTIEFVHSTALPQLCSGTPTPVTEPPPLLSDAQPSPDVDVIMFNAPRRIPIRIAVPPQSTAYHHSILKIALRKGTSCNRS